MTQRLFARGNHVSVFNLSGKINRLGRGNWRPHMYAETAQVAGSWLGVEPLSVVTTVAQLHECSVIHVIRDEVQVSELA
eukprot:10942451-Lingulodinium_polyedra.AAC.1